MSTCRYCGESDLRDTMLNYSTRANIHAACALKRPPYKNFRTFIFHVANLSDFPILLIKDEVPKLEALRDAFQARDYPESYIEICEDMIEQRLEELAEANRKIDRWSDAQQTQGRPTYTKTARFIDPLALAKINR